MNPFLARQNSVKDLSKPDASWLQMNLMLIKLEHPEFTQAQIDAEIDAKWKIVAENWGKV